MKKLLLLCCLLPLAVMAQIGPIQTQEKPYEFIGRYVFHDKKTDIYYLHVQSDNEYEDKVVRYKIGTTPTEAAKSISNLYAALQNVGQQFELGGRTYVVAYDWAIKIQKSGDLYYTAGDYTISKWGMEETVRQLISKYGAELGDVTVIATHLFAGKIAIISKDYGMTFNLELKQDLRPLVEKVYEQGDTLTSSDACALHQACISGVIEHPLLMKVCVE